MSKRINVNPGQYKVAGRERPGQGVVTEIDKQELAQDRTGRSTRRRRRRAKGSGK